MIKHATRTAIILLGILIFWNPATAQTILMQEGFESGALPAGWNQIYESAPPVDWQFQNGGYTYSSASFEYDQTPPAAHSGSYNAVFHSGSSSVSMIVSPAFDLSTGKVAKLEYWRTQGCYYNQALNVYYREGLTGPWNLLTSTNEVVFSWAKDSVIIPSVASEVYLAFQGIWDGGCGVCLDDITLYSLNPYNVEFTVHDHLGAAVQGAIVTFNGITKLTGTDGKVLYSQVTEGLGYKYDIRKNGYSHKKGSVNVTGDVSQNITIYPSRIIYVDPSPETAEQNGHTWDSAFVTLDDALADANAGDQIWLAEGVYYPTQQWNVSSPRAYSFELKKEVAIFGGFSGTPGEEDDRSTQSVQMFKSVLSGDIDKNDITDADGLSTSIQGNNAFFVIFNNNNGLDNTAIINGVYISGGCSDLGAYRYGGAIYNHQSSPTFNDCYIIGNKALSGGVVYNNNSNSQFFHTSILQNIGGGMQNDNSPTVIESCTFSDNIGNGLLNESSDLTIRNSAFNGNATNGVFNETSITSFYNCEFKDNILDGVYTIYGADCVLDSCQLTGNGQYGINADNASAQLDSCIVSGNDKGGVYSMDVSSTTNLAVLYSTVSENGDGSVNGGGIHSEGLDKTILYNIKCNENAGADGGAVYIDGSATVKLTNIEFWNNTAANDGGATYFTACNPTLYQVSAEGNTAAGNGGFLLANAANPSLSNTVIWNSTAADANVLTAENGAVIAADYSCIEGGFASGTNIITDDPAFIDAEYGLLLHKGYSPVIEAGTDLNIDEDLLMFDRPQPVGGNVDLGAYERGPGIDIIGGFPYDNQQIVGKFSEFKIIFNEDIIKGSSGSITVYSDQDNSVLQSFDILSDVTVSGDTAIFTAASELEYGKYHIAITKDAFFGSSSGYGYYGTISPKELNFEIFREQVYVNPQATGTPSGWDWHNAVLGFQDALDIAVPGQEIWISAGTFIPSIEVGGTGDRYRAFVLQNGNHVYGGFSGIPGTEGDMSARNTAKYPTVFSGDRLGDDDGTLAAMADNSYRIIVNDNTEDILTQDFILSGVTFTGGNADGGLDTDNGSCMYLSSCSMQIDSCTFIGNNANGAIVFSYEANATDTLFVTNSRFINNTGSATIFKHQKTAVVSNCTFSNNENILLNSLDADIVADRVVAYSNTADQLFDLSGGSAKLSNMLIHSNTGISAINLDGITAAVHHATIAGNTFSGTSIDYSSATVEVQNSILWNNATAEIGAEATAGPIDYNIISGGDARGANNIDSDPIFYNPANNIFSVMQCSPAIDAGTALTITTDINGTARPQGSGTDIGAYERKDGPCLVSSDPADEYFGKRQETFTLTFSENITQKLGNIYIYTKDDNTLVETVDMANTTVSGSELEFTVSTAVSFDEFYLLIDSAAIVSSTDDTRVFDGIISDTVINFEFHNTIKYVDIDATGANNGFDWANAFNNLQDAVDACIPEDVIWVAEGTYLPTTLRDGSDPRSASFSLADSVQIFGGFSALDDVFANRDPEAYPTILSGDLDGDDSETAGTYTINGDNAYHIIYSNAAGLTSNTALNGFIIKGGNATGTASVDKYGGAIFMAFDSVRVDQCVFIGNYATASGGAISSSQYISISNAEFKINTSESGAAIYAQGALTIKSSNFTGNTSSLSGGALFTEGLTNSSISSCQFSANSAVQASVLYSSNDNITILNCLAYKNTAANSASFAFSNSTAEIVNTTIASNSGTVSTGISATFSSTISVYNAILWNDPIAGVQINTEVEAGSSLTVFNSIIGDDAEDDGSVYAGVLNIDLDPRFVDPATDNYNLQRCSPAIEAGNNGFVETLASNDMVGNSRIFDGDNDGTAIVDMGAIENQGDCETVSCPATYDACWTGCLSTNWFDANNWSTLSIPDANTVVYIPGQSVVCEQPLIIGAAADCKTISIDVDDNAQVTIDPDNGGKLQMGL